MLGPSAKNDGFFNFGFLTLWPLVSKTAEAARDAAIIWACAVLFIIIGKYVNLDGAPGMLETTGGRIVTFALLLKAAFWMWRSRSLPSTHALLTEDGGRRSHEIRERTQLSLFLLVLFAVLDTVYTLSVISNSDIGNFIASFFFPRNEPGGISDGFPAAGDGLCAWLWLAAFLAWRRM